jgi:hypothetical protein
MKNEARGVFDEQFRLDKIGKQNDPLVKFQARIIQQGNFAPIP